jgi:WD40 repeat protein/serine/threonine protein kinase
MDGPEPKLREFFSEALRCQTAEAQAAYLEQACQGDAELRARLDELLQAHWEAGSFLHEPSGSRVATLDERPLTERPGTVIGPYKLLEQIGEGGFGVVFMALQQQPLRRRVALKVLKPGMDTRQVIARFEAERQALAMMDHQNIARVLDAGATDSGRPYFVMELVRGIPITQFCDDNQRTLRERLELFVTVCQAVQHAHQKGIIHRDLKPGNVLVTLQDDSTPLVKVIDFGIAKALGQERLTDKTLCTGFAQMLGTPLYMSPEQAQMSAQDVDTRTDIYALGVLLYELLTGTTPLDKNRLKEANFDEIRRIIREEEPAKPSTRISTLGQVATTVSANRKSDPKRLSQLFRGELDWIVMKALEKDRNRRYDTASSFAADVQHYLHDEPVQACPPSALYRFRKFARRNKAALVTATAVGLAVLLAVAGLATSTVLIAREQQATTNALQAESRTRADLEQALERERQNSYYQRIALAEREWSANNFGRVEQLLDTCPADLRGWEWHYLHRLRHDNLLPLRHAAAVSSAVFSPDGRWIASGSQDGLVRVWNALTAKERFRFQAHESHVRDVAFSPDGRYLATASWDATARLWHFDPQQTSGEMSPLFTFRHRRRVQSVAFSPDSQRLVSNGDGHTVRVWDTATGDEIVHFPAGTDNSSCIAYSPDGQTFAAPSDDTTVKIRDAGTGEERLTLPGHNAWILAISFSRDGRLLAVSTGDYTTKSDGEIHIWDLHTGQRIWRLRGHTVTVWRAQFSPDGQRLASAGSDQTVKIWDLRTGQEALTLRGHRGAVGTVDFSPDGTRLVSASYDGTVRIWDARSLGSEAENESITLTAQGGTVRSVAFSPDGQWLASVEGDGTVRLWEQKIWRAGAAKVPLRTLDGCNGVNTRVAFSHDSKLLACGGEPSPVRGRTKVWDLLTGNERFVLRQCGGPPAFSPNGKYLVTFSASRTDFILQVRDAATGEEIRPLSGHGWQISDLAFDPHPDVPHLASACADGSIRIWDVKTGEQIVAPLRHAYAARCVAFSRDGRYLASGGHDRLVKVWETQTWKLLHELPDPTGSVESVAFHPKDSRMLAWANTDGTVKIWDSATKETHTLRGHTSWVEGVAFSPDGKWLASASLDGTVKLWLVPSVPRPARSE